MNFLSKLLLPKVAGPIGAVLLALITYLGVTGYTKSQRIESLTVQLKSCEGENAIVVAAAQDFADSNLQKDEVIRRQTVSIKALKEKSDANTLAYQRRVDAARSSAGKYKDQASAILKLDAGTTEELGLCRAARDLLEKELTDAP